MAFNTQEQEIIRYGVENGKSRQEVEKALADYRLGVQPKPIEVKPTTTKKKTGVKEKVDETASDIAETVKAVGGQYKATVDRTADVYSDPNATLADKILATGSELYKLGSRSFGEVVVGVGKVSLSQEQEDEVRKLATQVGQTAADSVMVQKVVTNVVDKWNKLTPEQKRMWGNIGGFVEGGVDLVTLGMTNKFLIKPTRDIFKKIATQTGREIDDVAKMTAKPVVTATKEATEEGLASGVIQKGKEFSERIPRVAARMEESAKEAAERAAKLKASSPAVQTAIKSELPEKTIDLVAGADTFTAKDMRKMYDIVTSKSDVRPSSVAGEAASKQYSIIDAKRRAVGQELGDAIDALPNTTIDISGGLSKLDQIVQGNNIRIINGKLTKRSFDNTNYTDKEIAAIIRLYDSAKKGIKNGTIDAQTIHAKDSLFSKLKREDKAIEGLRDIYVEADGQVMPIYDAFRNVFRSELDALSPDISRLNKQYAIYRSFVDDMDSTIFKQSKLNTSIDPAESAAINLRRIESNALSQPAFQQVINDMNVIAKDLGYEGADPAQLIKFSLELNSLFPDTIPKASFAGGIRTSFGDVLQRIMGAGAPDVRDQQKAIKAMLDELLSGTDKVEDISNAVKANTSKKVIDLNKKTPKSSSLPNKQGGMFGIGAVNKDVRKIFGNMVPTKTALNNLKKDIDSAKNALNKLEKGDAGYKSAKDRVTSLQATYSDMLKRHKSSQGGYINPGKIADDLKGSGAGTPKNLIEEARNIQTTQELYKNKEFQALKTETERLKQIGQEQGGAENLKNWRESLNSVNEIEETVRQNEKAFRKTALRERDLELRKSDPEVDRLNKRDTNTLSKEAQKHDTAESFVKKIRGSSTQYGDYTPKLRRFVQPTAKRVSEIDGVDQNMSVTMYRGIDDPTGRVVAKINAGDFVTTNYDEALAYADSPANVVSRRVTVKALVEEYPNEFDVDTFATQGSEFIYMPQVEDLVKITDTQLEDIWKQANNK